METIPEDLILEFPSDTLDVVRTALNINGQNAMNEVLDSFQEWIQKQNHLIKKDFSRRFLENMIISAKGSLERAKQNLDKICTAKTLRRDLAENIDVNKYPNLTTYVIPAIMPKMTQNYHRVFVVRVISADFDTTFLYYYYKFIMMMVEYIKFHDYSLGLHVVFDSRNVNVMKMLLKVNILETKYLINLGTEGYGLRLKGIHVITESTAMDTILGFAKHLITPKLRDRIHVHTDVESLYEHIPKDILPQEYGGKEESLESIHSDWRNVLGSKEILEVFKESVKPATDESLRPTESYNEEILGVSGTFRNMTVD